MLSTLVRRPRRVALLTAAAVGAAAAASMAGAFLTAAVASPQPASVRLTTEPLDHIRELQFRAGDGVPNHVELREVSGGIEIKDTRATVELALGTEPGCATVDDHTVRCSVTDVWVRVSLADGNDYFKDYTAHVEEVIVYGGDGDDLLLGGASHDSFHAGDGEDELQGRGATGDLLSGDAGDDYILGGTGADTVHGGDGDDHLHGGDGDDRFFEGPGADDVQGGYGKDTVAYPHHNGVSVTLDNVANDGTPPRRFPFPLPGEGDNVRSNVENIVGSPGDDSLSGSDKANHIDGSYGDDVLKGGAGNDTVDGGEGSDKLYGENGDDYLDAQRGSGQYDHGGPGRDTCVGYDTERDDTCEK